MDDSKLPSQAQLKRWGKLTQEKFRRQQGRFLAEGEKVVAELLTSGRPLESLLIREDQAIRLADLGERVSPTVESYLLTVRQWTLLSQDPSPEGIMAIAVTPPVPDPKNLVNGQGPLLILDRVGNPNNLGALLRTAHWFGFVAVLLGAGSCEVNNPKVVRASMGSLFHLAVAEALDLEALLPVLRQRYTLVGSDPERGSIPHPCGPATALLLGSESHGLSSALLEAVHERWRIPGGGAESLSLPQAAAILMYECTHGTFAVSGG